MKTSFVLPIRKRIFIFLLCFTSIFSFISLPIAHDTPAIVCAKGKNDVEKNTPSIDISAKSAVLIDNQSGRILYQKKKDVERVPASITKIMTLLLIFDALDEGKIHLNDTVSVSENAAKMGGSQVFLEPGETQTVDTMIKCISVASANDAAVAMAEHISGSTEEFVKAMNKRAKKLGMKHTHFKNCNGLDDSIESGHYTSAYDVALMSRELMIKYPEIKNYSTIWMDTITHSTKKGDSEFGLTNTNKLIRTYDGITGLKTGSTSKAKYCLSATAKRNGVNLTAVIMAAPDHKIRFTEAAKLLDYGFSNCQCIVQKKEQIKLPVVKIHNAIKPELVVRVEKDFVYTLISGEDKNKIKKKITIKKNIAAPVKEGTEIGNITYTLDGEKIEEIPIVSAENIKKTTYPDMFRQVVKRYFFHR